MIVAAATMLRSFDLEDRCVRAGFGAAMSCGPLA
jgi:hypothetical protein